MLAASVFALTLAALADAAAANHLRFSAVERGIRVVWSPLTLELTFNGTPYSVACPVTLEGSFSNATIAKTAGSQIGSITRATVAEASCRGRIGSESPYQLEMTFLRETLPWQVRYASFVGTLPNISDVNVDVVGAAFEVHNFIDELTCLWVSTATSPWRLVLGLEARGVVSRPDSSFLIPRSRGLLCRELSTSASAAPVTQIGSTSALTITLI
jgi:hypothetical protein